MTKLLIHRIYFTFISLLGLPFLALAQAPPPGFVPPALHPDGATLEVTPLGNNVYALMSSKPPVDNAGFVVGEKGVLVIDAHIDGKMAEQIISAVRSVTNKPILYLVNTNGYADHVFGNYAFPVNTKIIAHTLTKEMMSPDLETLKKRYLGMVRGDTTVFEDVKIRMPDLVFDDFMEIDLGGTTIELHHFGAGNTAGDTVVYVPSVKTVWTGNLILGEGSLPFLLRGDTTSYIETLNNFSSSIDIKTIIPGHGIPTTSGVFNRYTDYLNSLNVIVNNAKEQDLSLEQTLKNNPLENRFLVPDGLSSTEFYRGLHPFNIQKIYLEKNK